MANKAKVTRLSSMTRKGFFAEEKPELESLHESPLIGISVQGNVDIKARATTNTPELNLVRLIRNAETPCNSESDRFSLSQTKNVEQTRLCDSERTYFSSSICQSGRMVLVSRCPA